MIDLGFQSNGQKFIFFGLCALIVASVVFGGAPNSVGSRLLVTTLLGGLTLAAIFAWGDKERLLQAPTSVYFWLGLVVAIPILQLVPLPPSLWQALPGRETATNILAVVGADTAWRPLTLNPLGTKVALLAMLPALVVFFGALNLQAHHRIRLFQLVAVLGVISVAVGIFQVTSRGAWLNFYDTQHDIFLLGFFANRNHAALLLCFTTLIFAWLIWQSKVDKRNRKALTGVLLIFALGPLLATYSRAGMALFALSAIAVIWYAFAGSRRIRPSWIIGGIVGVSLLVAVTIGLSDTASRAVARFSALNEDMRWDIWRVSLDVLNDHWVVGSGLGSFVPLYAAAEPIELLQPRYVNHAHNDYIELVIEAGILGGIVVLGAFALLVSTGKGLVEKANKSTLLLLLVPCLALLHSFIDYPLRTPAIGCIAALCFAHCVATLSKNN